ncbi:hypothetical protein [Citrobacter freundii]|uniref:Uncharacterized protein n=1 Tax=Citrobacter freundii TaxID=546 RepID=A0A7G2IXK1_CITFR|nr:hypothetical protein [Citrobacter freundii]
MPTFIFWTTLYDDTTDPTRGANIMNITQIRNATQHIAFGGKTFSD